MQIPLPPAVASNHAAENARIAPLVAYVLADLGRALRPGMKVRELEPRALELFRMANVAPKMLGYRGFPSPIAVSVDDEVLHGIPGDRTLRAGDLVKIQLGGRTQRGCGDQGWTFAVGELSPAKARLHAAGVRALKDGIATLRAGSRVGTLGAAIQAAFEDEGFSAVREFVGYAIGAQPMEDPQLPCYGVADRGKRLDAGVILHVHAIGAERGHEVKILDDNWTAVTVDGGNAVLFTAMVRVHATGCDLLTPLPG